MLFSDFKARRLRSILTPWNGDIDRIFPCRCWLECSSIIGFILGLVCYDDFCMHCRFFGNWNQGSYLNSKRLLLTRVKGDVVCTFRLNSTEDNLSVAIFLINRRQPYRLAVVSLLNYLILVGNLLGFSDQHQMKSTVVQCLYPPVLLYYHYAASQCF